jgi:4-aminobutyrate aminotransferase-like enzyme
MADLGDNSSTLDRHRRVFGDGAPLFYDEPVEVVRGEGVWLFDSDGRRYLDAYNNVPCVGHANPRVVAAVSQQMATLQVHSRYVHGVVVGYAERLAALHANPLSSLVFACSGTEADEVAMSMARLTTGNRGFITTEAAYHGNNSDVGRLNDIAGRAAAGKAVDSEVRGVALPDGSRRFVQGVAAAIRSLDEAGIGVAAVLMCSILANEGLPPLAEGEMAEVADLVRGAGGLMIADEVQAGFARSGRWWGYEFSGFQPDIAVMGKPMGAGIPFSGVVAAPEVVDRFRSSTRYFNTFAATPVQAAAGMAVIDVIEDEGLLAQTTQVGRHLADGLRSIGSTDRLGEVRNAGLFVGADWLDADGAPDGQGARAIVNAARQAGALIGRDGPHGHVLKLRPPLVFSAADADRLLEIMASVLATAK